MSLGKHLPDGCGLRQATGADARHIDRFLRPADRAEMEALEGRPAGDMLDDAIARRSRVLTIRAEPTVLYGISPSEGLSGHAITWLAMTSTIVRSDLMNIMWLSRVQVELWQRRTPVLQSICDSRNNFHREWLEWLGFTAHSHLAAFGAARVPFDLYVRNRLKS